MGTDSLTGERIGVGAIEEAGRGAGNERTGGEDDLIREFIRGGDPGLFEALVRAHSGWLRRLLYTVFNGSREEIEDAEQEILIGIYSDIRRFRFGCSFKTFFYRYARNKAIDLLRKSGRRKNRERAFPEEEPAGSGPSPEEEYLRRERKAEVLEGLNGLESEERLILVMKDVEGFSIDEIARVTGKKSGTIKSRLHRTREKLFRILEGR